MRKFSKVRNRLRNNKDLRLSIGAVDELSVYTLKQLNDIAAATDVNQNWADEWLKQSRSLKHTQSILPVQLVTADGFNLSWWEN